MKILKLRLKNLNSLYGEWQIDFTDDAFQTNGIFAITGPTGAGKSTILDAICLALYASTPRLGRITKSNNEIMSRQTGECFAEVIFQSQAGTFLARFDHRRAKKSATGALQEPEHQIADLDGNIIESKKSLVLEVVENKTGMDFDRFTRAMLLAQGNFDSFLKASFDQKSILLEQITGTEIYSEISKQVFENYKMTKLENEQLIQSVAHLTPLSAEEHQNLMMSQKALNDEVQIKQKQETELLTCLNWLANLKKSAEMIDAIKTQQASAEAMLLLHKDEEIKLEKARSANLLSDAYAPILVLNTQITENKIKHQTLTDTLPKLESEALSLQSKLSNEQALVANIESEIKIMAPILEQVKLLDGEINNAVSLQSSLLQEQTKLGSEQAQNAHLLSSKNKELKQAHQTIQASQNYIDEHKATDLKLIEQFAAIKLQLNSISEIQQQIQAINTNVVNLSDKFKTQSLALEREQKKIADLQSNIEKQKSAKHLIQTQIDANLNDRSIEEYKLEIDYLEQQWLLLNKIADYETQRQLLVTGEPCPLCGSKAHPFKENTPSQIQDVKVKLEKFKTLIDNVEALEKQLNQHAKQIIELEHTLQQHQNKHNLISLEIEHIQTAMKETHSIGERLNDQLSATLDEIKPIFSAIGITFKHESKEAHILQLENRINTYKTHEATLAQGNQTITVLNERLIVLNTKQQELDAQNSAMIAKVAHANASVEQLKAKRYSLLSDKIPAELEADNEKKLKQAMAKEKSTATLLQETSNKLNLLQHEIKLLQQQRLNAENEHTQLLHTFETACQQIGFSGITSYLAAKLSVEEFKSLEEKLKTLKENLNKFANQLEKANQDYAILQQQQLTDKTADELALEHVALKEAIDSIKTELAAITYKLKLDEATKDKLASIEHKLNEAKKKLNLHELLNSLIGSSDGKKYRAFAQGITFEIMVSHANAQLQKMNDRYLLVRDTTTPLSLNVIDNYQAGEVRSIKNLSGGECFIISLALALGLSNMSSQKVRVDSLFLDEGFGTLDEEALDIALDALSTLQKENKLIGIISHVSALKNRISTQIIIDAQNAGRSHIIGPSCTKL